MDEKNSEERFLNECTLTLSSDSKLHVHGSVIAYFSDDKIDVVKISNDNDSSSELVLDVIIASGNIPIDATPRVFTYTEQGAHVSDYKQVIVRYNDDVCKIDVK